MVKKRHGYMGRSLNKTRLIGKMANSDNEEVPFDIIVDGNFRDIERANIAAAKHFGTNRLYVTETHFGKQFVSTTLEKFLSICDFHEIVWED